MVEVRFFLIFEVIDLVFYGIYVWDLGMEIVLDVGLFGELEISYYLLYSFVWF